MAQATAILADQALLPEGWAARVRIDLDGNGPNSQVSVNPT